MAAYLLSPVHQPWEPGVGEGGMGGRRIPRERGARLEAWSYRLLLPRFSYLYNGSPLFTFLFIYLFILAVLGPCSHMQVFSS